MTKSDLIDVVKKKLPPRGWKFQDEYVKKVVDAVFNSIKEAVLCGDSVAIKGFGTFDARLIESHRMFNNYKKQYSKTRPYIRISFKTASGWREELKVLIRPQRRAARKKIEMEKYGYEKSKDDKKAKTAAEKGRCPLCGLKIKGRPPVCPKHGSEPFEEREK